MYKERENFKECLKALGKIKGIFLAYNSNIDVIKKLDSKLEGIARKFGSTADIFEEISTPKELFSCIMYSMKYGEAMEIGMEKKVGDWLKNNIVPDRKRIGGQTGIMSNHLSLLGVRAVVYTPFLSREQKRFFRKGVLFFDEESGEVKKLWEIKRENDPVKKNWIFEYEKGQKFLNVVARNNSRFIASSRLDGFVMRDINPDFDFDSAILSGFHAIKKNYEDGTNYKYWFKIAERVFERIRSAGREIHLEFAYNSDKDIMKKILRLASLSNSLGLDEQEVMLILKSLGKEKIAEKIHETHSVEKIYEGMMEIARKLKGQRLHLHGRNYFMSLHSKSIMPKYVKRAMEFAGIVAASYAKYDVSKIKDIAKGLEIPISKEGMEKREEIGKILGYKGREIKEGIFENNKHFVVFTPNRTVKKVRDIVGLGDIISSTIFACERAFLNIRKKEY